MSLLCAPAFGAHSTYQASESGFEAVRESGIAALSDCGTDELRFRNPCHLGGLSESRLESRIEPNAFHTSKAYHSLSPL
jgi:hypothetical protein